MTGNPDYYGRFGFQNESKLTYGDVSTRYVQWLAFGDAVAQGALKFSPAFKD